MHNNLDTIFKIIEDTGFNLLPISPQHILTNAALPLHLKDPFDRIIIAQSIAEDLVVITKDKLFAAYKVKLFWE
ncbi:MAG: type II toxin-antitoxin system VapC family toxin [Chitinophagales bacterium]|nr:type II toxin-antitoxin system VapC family toxin [Chitinophagales bacterium]